MMEDGTVASSVVESSSHGIDDTTKDDSKEEKHQSHTSYDDGVEVELSNEKERAVSIGNDEPNDVMIKSNEEVETGGHQYSSPYIGFQVGIISSVYLLLQTHRTHALLQGRVRSLEWFISM
jgi:hypothetical protein